MHNECIVKLTDGSFDWYDPVWKVEIMNNGDLFIECAIYNYTIKASDWEDYKVREYNPKTTYNWEIIKEGKYE